MSRAWPERPCPHTLARSPHDALLSDAPKTSSARRCVGRLVDAMANPPSGRSPRGSGSSAAAAPAAFCHRLIGIRRLPDARSVRGTCLWAVEVLCSIACRFHRVFHSDLVIRVLLLRHVIAAVSRS